MLHRLERADLAAEGDAVESIVAAHLQRAVGAANLLEGAQHGGTVEHLGEDAPTLAGSAQRLGLAVLESDLRLATSRIEVGQAFHLDAAALEIDQE